MKIIIHSLCCRAIFHTDCDESTSSGIVQEHAVTEDKSQTLIECLHCHQKGIILKGTPFHTNVCAEEIPEDFDDFLSQCKPMSKAMKSYLDDLAEGVEVDLNEVLLGFSECPQCTNKLLTNVSGSVLVCLACGYTLVMTQ